MKSTTKTITITVLLLFMGCGMASAYSLALSQAQVTQSEDCISTQLTMENWGDSMQESVGIEQQIRPAGTGPLSILWRALSTVSPQDVCDPMHPENVHRMIQVDANDEVTFTLESCGLEPGYYDVYLISATKCYNEPPVGNEPVEPFGYGSRYAERIEVREANPNPECESGEQRDETCTDDDQAIKAFVCLNNGEWADDYRIVEWCSFDETCVNEECEYVQTTTTTQYPTTTSTTQPHYCGNSVCDRAYGENSDNCPQDCGRGDDRNNLVLIASMFGAVLLLLIGGMYIRRTT